MIRHQEEVCGVPFTCNPEQELLSAMGANIAGPRVTKYVSITNTESMYFALRDGEHKRYIQNAEFSCCDGVGVVLAGFFQGKRVPRFHGPDFMLRCCEYGARFGWRHYFYGGRPGVAAYLTERLMAMFPGTVIAGSYCPPFRPLTPQEDFTIIETISAARPDVVWVGLGLLKQERWIAAHLDKIAAPCFVGVGAAFDFCAGTVQRAPLWIRTLGLEWLYRVIREPRMFRRNVRSFVFLGEAAMWSLRQSRNHVTRV